MAPSRESFGALRCPETPATISQADRVASVMPRSAAIGFIVAPSVVASRSTASAHLRPRRFHLSAMKSITFPPMKPIP